MKRKNSQQANTRLSRRKVLAGMVTAPVIFAGSGEFFQVAAAAESAADSPDVIVIGAGAIGCSTAWHLRQRGLNVLVVEAQATPASQSTGGAAGFVSLWSGVHADFWKQTEWELQRYGIDFYTQLAKRTDGKSWFSPCGIAYIYQTERAWKRVQPRIGIAKEFGTKLEILTAERAKEVTPFLEYDKLAGVAYGPEAVRVRAGDCIQAFAKQLADAGVKFRYNTKVTGFLRDGDRIVGVRTEGGDIHSKRVIVAAGAWSRPLLEMLNVKVPSSPYTQTRFVTKPLAGIKAGMPLLIVADKRHFYIREEQGGLLIGGADDRPRPADRDVDADHPPWCDKIPQAQAYRLQKAVNEITPIMPVLGKIEIDNIRSGLPTSTKNRFFIAGPVPGIEGLLVMSGCQEAGVTHGPGLGRILSEYAIDGKTHWDVEHYRLEKFMA
jgi:sarcosine oxidase, subunit beta